jgi:hypothetical protein
MAVVNIVLVCIPRYINILFEWALHRDDIIGTNNVNTTSIHNTERFNGSTPDWLFVINSNKVTPIKIPE